MCLGFVYVYIYICRYPDLTLFLCVCVKPICTCKTCTQCTASFCRMLIGVSVNTGPLQVLNMVPSCRIGICAGTHYQIHYMLYTLFCCSIISRTSITYTSMPALHSGSMLQKRVFRKTFDFPLPIGSMYVIFTCIYHKN